MLMLLPVLLLFRILLLLLLLLLQSGAAAPATVVVAAPAQKSMKNVAALATPIVFSETLHEDIALLAVAVVLF